MAGGRPRLFNTVEELEVKIQEFYDYCELKEVPLTFERLATFIGIDRRTIYNYEQKDEFFPTIKRVRDKIQADIMERGMSGAINPTFGIFCLKNYGYTDKQEITSTNTNVNKNIDMSQVSTEDLKKLIDNED